MQDELNKLQLKIGRFHEPPTIDDETWEKFAARTTVMLMAGGESSRFSPVLNGKEVNKSAFELPNGDTMIEMTIRMYRDAGIKRFVASVFHNAHSIEHLLGDGHELGVEIVYSYDPEQPVGKGGAVRHALDNGSVPQDNYLIVQNPDDVVLDFPGSLPRYIAQGHLEGKAEGKLATVVAAPSHPYPFSGLMVVENEVVDIEMYPEIPVPAHTGTTVFSPLIYPRFQELFDLTKKNDFEAILFPLLAQEQKLWAVGLTLGTWIAVNDLKSYNQLVKYLEGK